MKQHPEGNNAQGEADLRMVFAELIRIITARDKAMCKEGLDATRS